MWLVPFPTSVPSRGCAPSQEATGKSGPRGSSILLAGERLGWKARKQVEPARQPVFVGVMYWGLHSHGDIVKLAGGSLWAAQQWAGPQQAWRASCSLSTGLRITPQPACHFLFKIRVFRLDLGKEVISPEKHI